MLTINPRRLIVSGLFVLILSISFSALASQNCNDATRLVTQAYDWGDSGRKDKEKQLLQQALQICPNHADAHNNLGALLEEEGNYPQAIDHYRQAIQARTHFSEAWYGLGEVYYKQGRFPLSFEAHLHACKNDADSRRRIISFLKNNNYAVTKDEKILDRESLLVFFDKQRRTKIDQLIGGCGLKAGPVTSTYTFRNFHFDSSKATLQAGSEAQLEEIAGALREIKPSVVKIYGHTDIQTFKGVSQWESDRLNWKLSKDRAASVAYALALRGVPITWIETKGFGHTKPAAPYSIWDFTKNRRVEIKVE